MDYFLYFRFHYRKIPDVSHFLKKYIFNLLQEQESDVNQFHAPITNTCHLDSESYSL